jgi:hypothetical protein
MKKSILLINIVCHGVIIGFLFIFVVNGLVTGYPWTLTCYNCNICRLACPLGIDPHGFITSALSNDPDLYITADHIRLTLGDAVNLDPEMVLNIDTEKIRAGEAKARGMRSDREVVVMHIIEDLADNGVFGG